MPNKYLYTVLIAILMVVSALAAFLPSDSANPSVATPSMPNIFSGIINIAPNGTVVYNGTGYNNAVTQVGDHYTLTGEVLGEISIEHNGTILNGLNHLVTTDASPTPNMLNITNATDVYVSNITLNSANQTGIFIDNASEVHVSNVNVSAYEIAVQISNNTEYINVSNSVLSFNPDSSVNVSTVVDGGFLSSNGFITFLSTSHNNYFFNDTIYGSCASSKMNLPESLLSNAKNTVFNGLHFIGPSFTGAGISADNESLIHSSFTGFFLKAVAIRSMNVGATSINALSPSYTTDLLYVPLEMHNVTVADNTFNLYRTAGTPPDVIYAIYTASDVNISGNIININNAGGPSESMAAGIFAQYMAFGPVFVGNGTTVFYQDAGTLAVPSVYNISEVGFVSIKDNTISIVNSSKTVLGIESSGAIVNISGNSIYLPDTDTQAVSLYGSYYSNVSDNTITLANSSNPIGIFVQGGANESINLNTILNTNQSVGGIGVFPYYTQNETIGNNTISGFLMDLASTWSSNVTFVGNYLENSNTSLSLDSSNNFIFYHNDFTNYSYAPANITNSTQIYFNETYPTGGNYWSGYTGTASPDGFGPTPFAAAPGFEDYLPLTHPWTRPQAIFTETGLNAGSAWSITFNGQAKFSTLNTIAFHIQGGAYNTYQYVIGVPSGFYTGNDTGSKNYSGNSVTTAVSFVHYAYLNGTILPSNATVLLNGIVQNGLSNGSFNLSIKAGSYELIVKDSGYTTYYENFTVSPNQTEHIHIALNGTSGSNVQDYYYIGGGIAAVALVGGAVFALRRNPKA